MPSLRILLKLFLAAVCAGVILSSAAGCQHFRQPAEGESVLLERSKFAAPPWWDASDADRAVAAGMGVTVMVTVQFPLKDGLALALQNGRESAKQHVANLVESAVDAKAKTAGAAISEVDKDEIRKLLLVLASSLTAEDLRLADVYCERYGRLDDDLERSYYRAGMLIEIDDETIDRVTAQLFKGLRSSRVVSLRRLATTLGNSPAPSRYSH